MKKNTSNINPAKILCFGELLLRLSPDANGEWLKQNKISVYPAGAEANVATALALWDIDAVYLTALPNNFLSHQLLSYLQAKNIDVSKILLQGERMGIYFLPEGKDVKNPGVTYDRKHSSFSQLQPGVIDWNHVLQDVSWFHVSAITPALSNNLVQVCKEAFEIASKKNITISVDLNYRAKLWQYGKQPIEIMPQLVQYCDVVMGNIWAAEKMLDIVIDKRINQDSGKEDYLQQAKQTSEEIMKKFGKVKAVANTFRFTHRENAINYYATLYSGGQLYTSADYTAEKIIGKVGSGDCFMAGLIYALTKKYSASQTLEFATAAAFTKLFTASDTTDKKVAEILKCVQSNEK